MYVPCVCVRIVLFFPASCVLCAAVSLRVCGVERVALKKLLFLFAFVDNGHPQSLPLSLSHLDLARIVD